MLSPDVENSGLLLVSHGTRSEVGTQQFLKLADAIARRFAPLPVEPAFLEFQQPDIDAGVGRLLERGVTRLVTLPLLLFAAGHAKRDIPCQVSAALERRGHNEMQHVQAAHLGCHPALLELSARRLEEVAGLAPNTKRGISAGSTSDVQTAAPDTCLLLVGRGSHDESATAEMHELARLRQQSVDQCKVEVAFVAMARPLLLEKLGELARQSYQRVVVQPHLLFDGELVEAIERQMSATAACCSEQEWIITRPLAADLGFVTFVTDLIRKVIEDRCREAGIRVVALEKDD